MISCYLVACNSQPAQYTGTPSLTLPKNTTALEIKSPSFRVTTSETPVPTAITNTPTFTFAPSITPIPPTPEYSVKLSYNPEDNTLYNYEATTIFALDKTGKWIRILPELIEERIKSNEWEVWEGKEGIFRSKRTGYFHEAYNFETDSWETDLCIESVAYAINLDITDSILLKHHDTNGFKYQVMIDYNVYGYTGVSSLNFDEYLKVFSRYIAQIWEEASGGVIDIGMIDGAVVTLSTYNQIYQLFMDQGVDVQTISYGDYAYMILYSVDGYRTINWFLVYQFDGYKSRLSDVNILLGRGFEKIDQAYLEKYPDSVLSDILITIFGYPAIGGGDIINNVFANNPIWGEKRGSIGRWFAGPVGCTTVNLSEYTSCDSAAKKILNK